MRRDNRFFVIKIAAAVVAVIAALILAVVLFKRNSVSPENENEYMTAKVSSSPKPTAIDIDMAADTDVLNDDEDYDDEQGVNIEVTDSVSPEFFMMDAGGEVVVYYSDKRTVFMHTGIPADMLGADERERLKVGYYIDNEEELYALLESYSS